MHLSMAEHLHTLRALRVTLVCDTRYMYATTMAKWLVYTEVGSTRASGDDPGLGHQPLPGALYIKKAHHLTTA